METLEKPLKRTHQTCRPWFWVDIGPQLGNVKVLTTRLSHVQQLNLCALLFAGLTLPCIPSITILRSSRIVQTQGMSISLRCPVYLCYQDHLPNVTWCRIAGEQCEHVEPDDRMTSWWEDTIENEAIHVVRIHPVQTNDSGLYKCTATFMAEQIVGRVLEVAIGKFKIRSI